MRHPDRTLSEWNESKGEWRDLLFVWGQHSCYELR